eukprot:3930711-Rhodomonas_salina.2
MSGIYEIYAPIRLTRSSSMSRNPLPSTPEGPRQVALRREGQLLRCLLLVVGRVPASILRTLYGKFGTDRGYAAIRSRSTLPAADTRQRASERVQHPPSSSVFCHAFAK